MIPNKVARFLWPNVYIQISITNTHVSDLPEQRHFVPDASINAVLMLHLFTHHKARLNDTIHEYVCSVEQLWLIGRGEDCQRAGLGLSSIWRPIMTNSQEHPTTIDHEVQ